MDFTANLYQNQISTTRMWFSVVPTLQKGCGAKTPDVLSILIVLFDSI